MSSNFFPMLSSSPPPIDDADSPENDDEDDDFGTFASANSAFECSFDSPVSSTSINSIVNLCQNKNSDVDSQNSFNVTHNLYSNTEFTSSCDKFSSVEKKNELKTKSESKVTDFVPDDKAVSLSDEENELSSENCYEKENSVYISVSKSTLDFSKNSVNLSTSMICNDELEHKAEINEVKCKNSLSVENFTNNDATSHSVEAFEECNRDQQSETVQQMFPTCNFSDTCAEEDSSNKISLSNSQIPFCSTTNCKSKNVEDISRQQSDGYEDNSFAVYSGDISIKEISWTTKNNILPSYSLKENVEECFEGHLDITQGSSAEEFFSDQGSGINCNTARHHFNISDVLTQLPPSIENNLQSLENTSDTIHFHKYESDQSDLKTCQLLTEDLNNKCNCSDLHHSVNGGLCPNTNNLVKKDYQLTNSSTQVLSSATYSDDESNQSADDYDDFQQADASEDKNRCNFAFSSQENVCNKQDNFIKKQTEQECEISTTECSLPIDVALNSTHGDNSEDDFGNFESVDKIDSGIMIQESFHEDAKDNISANDDFADFETAAFNNSEPWTQAEAVDLAEDNFANFETAAFKIEHSMLQESNTQTTISSTQEADKGIDKISKVINAIFPLPDLTHETEFPDESNFDVLEQNAKSRRLWDKLHEIEQIPGLRFQWGVSHSFQQLLRSVNVDYHSILRTSSVPFFASGLSLLEPTKGPVAATTNLQLEDINNSPKDPIPPVQFDWGSSGLVNPLDSGQAVSTLMDLSFLTSPDAVPSDSNLSKDFSLENELLRPSPAEVPTDSSRKPQILEQLLSLTTNSSIPDPQYGHRPPNLSQEATRVLDQIPDISFMRAKVLMFPISGNT